MPYFLRRSIWHASSSPIKPSIWDPTKSIISHVWSSSALCNPFSYSFLISVYPLWGYNTAASLIYLTHFLRISIWHDSSSPIKTSIWDYTDNRLNPLWSSSALYNPLSYGFLTSVHPLLGYNTAASLLSDLLFEHIKIASFLIPN